MKLTTLAAIGLLLAAATASAQQPAGPVEATTATGEKIRLMPDGKWEYVEGQKAAEQRTERAVVAKKQEEAQKVENDRERNAQGFSMFGLGRKIYPGDPDFNRGSLNPKLR